MSVPFDFYNCFAVKESMFEDQEVDCDIVIYNKKYIFGLCPPPGRLLKPSEFSK